MEVLSASDSPPPMANPAALIESRADIAQAKAEMAVMLSDSFREDINSLRSALQHANQLITTLQAENASIRASLAQAVPTFDFDTLRRADREASDVVDEDPEPPSHTPCAPSYPPRPDMQRPPPEGTIFSNGGPYSSSKTGERSNHNRRLKKELNDWTRARGYTVKIYRSRLQKKRAKLIISCVLAGRPKRVRPEEEEQQRREQAQDGGGPFRKQRVSKLSDCPLRFSLLEIVEGSGTFVVKHAMDSGAQRCNHDPNPISESDTEN